MNDLVEGRSGMSGIRWRAIGWGGAVVLLMLPFIAMQLQEPGVHWSLGDFIFAGLLFAMVGGLAELSARVSNGQSYRAGFFLALVSMFLVIWVNLAVGIVGSEHNPANNLFFGALFVGTVGATVARLRAGGLSLTMFATALCLWGAFAIAAMGPTDEPSVPHMREFIGTSLFASLFIASGLLFRRAACQSSSSS